MYASVFHLLFLIINILLLPAFHPYPHLKLHRTLHTWHGNDFSMWNRIGSIHLVYSISYKVFLNGISSICHQSPLLGSVLSRDYILLLPCCQEDSNSSYYLQPDTIFCSRISHLPQYDSSAFLPFLCIPVCYRIIPLPVWNIHPTYFYQNPDYL